MLIANLMPLPNSINRMRGFNQYYTISISYEILMAHSQSVVVSLATLVLFFSFHSVSSLAFPTSSSTISILSEHNNVTDKQALLSIKAAISHDPVALLASWNDSLHFCRWPGVACGGRRHPQRVTSLNLRSLGLVGYISPAMANLTFLKMMDLSDNQFLGTIPQEIGQLYRLEYMNLSMNSIRGGIRPLLSHSMNLSSLSVLFLANNQLSGEIPPTIGNLSSLPILVLYYNQFTGGIPPTIGNLYSLTRLYLYENQLSQSIPPSLGNLSNLTVLALYNNGLSGAIPTSLWNLSSLFALDLSGNSLSGMLPPNAFEALPLLKDFLLSSNQFHGPIPLSLANASHLEAMQVSDNMLSGAVPPNLGNLLNLQRLILSNNQLGDMQEGGLNFITTLTNCSELIALQLDSNNFGGMLPDSIANLSTSLQFLTMALSNISGNIPSNIGNLVGLTGLGLGRNQLGGSIPDSIGKLLNLHIVDLSHNELSGEIPAALGNLTQLNNLYLDLNKLSGNIPSTIGNCQQLVLLELQENKLIGSIPKEILRISAFAQSLNLSHNSLTGVIPLEVGNLVNLEVIDFSFNKLSGPIPSTFGKCAELSGLYLGGNAFQGDIPSSLASLSGLLVLDVSHNNLSGRIPDFLQGFGDILYLDLSFNNFEGEVPMHGVFENASLVSVLGNNKLCGGNPLMHLPACPSLATNKDHHSHVLLLIIPIVSAVLFFIFLCFLVARCWVQKSTRKPTDSSLVKATNVSYAELVRATGGFSRENFIGAGSVGTVYQGILDDGDGLRVVAVKVLNLKIQGASKSFLAECEAWRNIRHRNLAKIITVCSSIDSKGNDFKAVVSEFMANGSLDDWLHHKDNQQYKQKKLSLIQRLEILIDVASALEYLHCRCETPIVHCDVKPSNILLDSEMTAHVGDFGLAKILQETISNSSVDSTGSIGLKGTVGYIPPEYGMLNQVSVQGDVYSYGILLLEIFTAKRPTDEMFNEGYSLRKFVELAFPERIMDIADVRLFMEENEEASYNAQILNDPRTKELLDSVFEVGIKCSSELPAQRMKTDEVITDLYKIRDAFTRNENTVERRTTAH